MAKSAAFGVMHLGIAFGVSYALTGSVTIAAQVMKVENHLSGTTEVAVGDIDTVAFIVDSTFGVTDKLSVWHHVVGEMDMYRSVHDANGTPHFNSRFLQPDPSRLDAQLFVYAGSEHQHAAQQPTVMVLKG